MLNGFKVLALIPARGGSKGIPGKNIRELCGRPLIDYTIKAALNSRYIDSVVVTTDSKEIADVAKKCGASVPFLRPAEYARDTSKSIDALMHAVETFKEQGEEYDVVVWLQPTSPLRDAQDIDGALDTFYNHGCLGLVSVSPVSQNPVLTRRMDQSGILHPLLPISSTVRRQDMPPFYHVDGAICINKVSMLNWDISLNDNPVGHIIPENHAVDIDTYDDLKTAEELLNKIGSAN